jgi:hypothetical protein
MSHKMELEVLMTSLKIHMVAELQSIIKLNLLQMAIKLMEQFLNHSNWIVVATPLTF